MSGDLALLARTAVHLQPGQVAHRARLRAQRTALRRWPDAGRRLLPGPDPAAAKGWPEGFAPADATAGLPWPDLAELTAGRITLLGVTRDLGKPPAWQQADAPLLWRFHLHYWDWAWGLQAEADWVAARAAFGRLWRSWQDAAPFGGGDAWLPYPAALRAWSWCGLYRELAEGTEIEEAFTAELAAHAGFLRRHLESDVGGNHLIKELKALIGLAVFFDDDRLLGQALRRLARQLPVQVLSDGGHFERAPAYHCQVLADLIDIAGLLHAAAIWPPPEITGAIRRMRRWLGTVLAPDGTVPLLNDGYPVPAALLAVLAPEPRPGQALVLLADTGLVSAQMGGWQLLADIGAPCPDELPAHAHADTLGCILHADGAPLLADTATSTYAPGEVRDYERSTAAHSTVEVDGTNSTEVWGGFRAGRRARVHGYTARADATAVTFGAAHDGFRRLPGRPVHHRQWTLTADEFRAEDAVLGTGRHSAVVRWHLPPGATVRLEGAGAIVTTAAGAYRLRVSSPSPFTLTVESGRVAEGFQRTAAAPVLTCR
ncbi:MAG: heparinase II/III family protein, partial [Streptosporangiaceae bacterium]